MNALVDINVAAPGRPEWDEILGRADEIIAALLARMEAAKNRGEYERALQWAQTAASFIVFGGTFGRLAAAEIEQATVAMAQAVPQVSVTRAGSGPKRFLHVLTEAYELFGHTKLCRKWIEVDASGARHDVVLIDQYSAAPANLRESVESRGGKVTHLDRTQPLLTRARLLRELAYSEADVVVLHVHPNDVLPNVAFGIPGGPPVVYVNHADHEFWVGGAVADLVLDIRESGQEWTQGHRDILRTRILPIPLEEDPLLMTGVDQIAALRREVRQSLGVGETEFLFLTIGSARKYEPQRGLSFLEAAEAILHQCPQAKIVAVGPKPVAEWQAVAQRTGGRLLPIGNQSELGRFHAAADLYLEGMPTGSLTALLEVCLAGVACVRAPVQVQPPHASDGSAFAPVAQPANVPEYIREAVALAHDAAARQQRAAELQRRVRDTHCEAGWGKLLAQIVSELPDRHAVYPDQKPRAISREQTEFKLEYAYHQVARARAGLVTTLVQQAVRHCEDARRAVEKVLPGAVRADDATKAEAQPLFDAILPELRGQGTEPANPSRATLGVGLLAKNLMERAAEDGRRLAAWRLGVRLTRRCPGLWQQEEFRKGLAKSLPGMLTLLRIKNSRRG